MIENQKKVEVRYSDSLPLLRLFAPPTKRKNPQQIATTKLQEKNRLFDNDIARLKSVDAERMANVVAKSTLLATAIIQRISMRSQIYEYWRLILSLPPNS